MNAKSTTPNGPDGLSPEARAAAAEYESPPRFTREMAAEGRHVVGEVVLREGKPRGRPPKAEGERKEAVSIRLSPEVLAHFRAGGEGWQTRIDEALRGLVRIGTLDEARGAEEDRDTALARVQKGRRNISVRDAATGRLVRLGSAGGSGGKKRA